MMLYEHIAVPPFLAVHRLEQSHTCHVQVVGDLAQRSHAQSLDMWYANFYPDADQYLLLNMNQQTVAWLGFDIRIKAEMIDICVIQIQGRRGGGGLTRNWPQTLLTTLVAITRPDRVRVIDVLPARLNPYWFSADVSNMDAHRGRLLTYYDRIPKKLGFTSADIESVRSTQALIAKRPGGKRVWDMPRHTLQIGATM